MGLLPQSWVFGLNPSSYAASFILGKDDQPSFAHYVVQCFLSITATQNSVKMLSLFGMVSEFLVVIVRCLLFGGALLGLSAVVMLF